jgi:copper chaperone
MATEHHRLNVSGMSCEHCRCRVQRALEALPGVSSAEVSLKTGAVDVEADEGAVTREQLVAEVEKAGYSVTGGAS